MTCCLPQYSVHLGDNEVDMVEMMAIINMIPGFFVFDLTNPSQVVYTKPENDLVFNVVAGGM